MTVEWFPGKTSKDAISGKIIVKIKRLRIVWTLTSASGANALSGLVESNSPSK